MKDKRVTYGDLEQLLLRLDFAYAQTSEGHKIFEHVPSDTVVLLPSAQPGDVVDALHLAGVRRMVVDGGVVAHDDLFDHLLESVETSVLSKA